MWLSFWSITHLRVLGLKDDADHGKNYSDQETQLHTDQSRGWRGNQPNDGIIPAGPPLSRDILELPQCPPKADNDDTGKNTLLESVEERCEEEEDEKDDQGADQTRYLIGEQRNECHHLIHPCQANKGSENVFSRSL